MTFGFKDISSLGDCLYLTPALQAIKGQEHIIEMHYGRQSEDVSKVFDGLAKVVFVESPKQRLYITNKDRTHSAQRILNELGLKEVSCIPKIDLKQEEVDWAKDYLKEYDRSKVIAITNDNLGANDPTNYCAQYKRPPIGLMQYVTDYLIQSNYIVLQFGPKLNEWAGGIPTFTPLKGAIHIRNLEIRQQAACFSIIKKMFSGCTGLYHLALSVGSKCCIFHPPDNNQINYFGWDLHYSPELWKSEPIRAKYVDFTKFDGNLVPLLDFLNS